MKLNLKELSLQKEGLKNANEKREACQVCGLSASCETPFKAPYVPENYTRKLVIVSSGSESRREEKFIRRLSRQAGWQDEDTAIVPAVRCANESPSMSQIRACRPFLLQALHVLKPENVLGLGSTALRALRNDGAESIIKHRGREIEIPGQS